MNPLKRIETGKYKGLWPADAWLAENSKKKRNRNKPKVTKK